MSHRNRMLFLPFALAALLTLPVVASAHVPPQSTELDFRFGYIDFDPTGGELLVGMSIARNFSRGWGLEGRFDLVPSDDFNVYFLDANGVYNFDVAATALLVPYVSAGLGVASVSPEVGDSSSDLAVNFGGGLKYFASPRLAIRGDVRDHWIMGDPDDTHNLSVAGGLTWYFRAHD